MRILYPAPRDVDRRKLTLTKLHEENGSIEGMIEDVHECDAPVVRKYFERNAEYQKKKVEFLYTKEDVKEYSSIKSVLARRSQFN